MTPANCEADHTPVALITGASQRLGAAIARSLHGRGMRVVIHHHRSADAAAQLCATLEAIRPGSTLRLAADLASSDAPQTLVAAAHAHWGRLDVLINNAALFFSTALETSTLEDFDALINVNLRAPWLLARAAAAPLRQSTGCLINIVDVYAERPRPGFAVYCAAKAGLVGLTRALARDLAPRVRVNAIAPGAILWSTETSSADQRAILAKTPLGRLGSPEDIARAVGYLLDAPYVTGQVMNVDGGRSIFD